MRYAIALAAILVVSAAGAASLPPDEIDWRNAHTADEDEVRLPPGSWCLVLSVRNNRGEPRTLTYLRGTFDWCDPSDRVVVREKEKEK